MKKIVFIVLIIITISCTKEVNNYTAIDSDKEIRVDFPYGQIGGTYTFGDTSYSAKYIYSDKSQWLYDFDVTNYVNIDEVYFICKLQAWCDSSLIDLYDKTNNKPIEGSQTKFKYVKDSTAYYPFFDVKSPNFINSLPKSPINIAFRILEYNGQRTSSAITAASIVMKRKR